jgi:uncharacterized membrane protein
MASKSRSGSQPAPATSRDAAVSRAHGLPREEAGGQSAETPAAAARPSGPPRWLQAVSLLLAITGLGVSAYETYAHFNGSHLAGCPSNGQGTFDCTAVITSPQSMVFGVIPVAILGLAFYVLLAAMMTPWAWRMRRPGVAWLRLASVTGGMGFVLYLVYAELYQIGQVCEYCTVVHVTTFALFAITVVSAAIWGLSPAKPAS